MVFKNYPRYVSLIVLIIFNIIILFAFTGHFINFVFHIFSVVLIPFIFGYKYVLNDSTIIEYFFFIKTKVIDVSKIKKVKAVEIKKIGAINIYIGKTAKETKEDWYYLIMENNQRIKISSGYRNNIGETLGKYIVRRFNVKKEYAVKYKWASF